MDQAGVAAAGDGDESLSDAVRSVARRLRQASVELLARWDLTPSQFRALRTLTRHDTMRPSALSEHLRIAPRSATDVLDSLEAKELVQRRPDPEDRRATLVALTSHGVEVANDIRAASGSEAERIFDRLTPADRKQLARILRLLQD